MTLIELIVLALTTVLGVAVGIVIGHVFSDRPHWYHIVVGVALVLAIPLTTTVIDRYLPKNRDG